MLLLHLLSLIDREKVRLLKLVCCFPEIVPPLPPLSVNAVWYFLCLPLFFFRLGPLFFVRNSAGEPSCGAAFHFLRVLEACVQATCMLPSHSEIPLIDGYEAGFSPSEKRFVEISVSFESVVASFALLDEVPGDDNKREPEMD